MGRVEPFREAVVDLLERVRPHRPRPAPPRRRTASRVSACSCAIRAPRSPASSRRPLEHRRRPPVTSGGVRARRSSPWTMPTSGAIGSPGSERGFRLLDERQRPPSRAAGHAERTGADHEQRRPEHRRGRQALVQLEALLDAGQPGVDVARPDHGHPAQHERQRPPRRVVVRLGDRQQRVGSSAPRRRGRRRHRSSSPAWCRAYAIEYGWSSSAARSSARCIVDDAASGQPDHPPGQPGHDVGHDPGVRPDAEVDVARTASPRSARPPCRSARATTGDRRARPG